MREREESSPGFSLWVEAASSAGSAPARCLGFSPSRAQQAEHGALPAREHHQLPGKGKRDGHSCPPPAHPAQGVL